MRSPLYQNPSVCFSRSPIFTSFEKSIDLQSKTKAVLCYEHMRQMLALASLYIYRESSGINLSVLALGLYLRNNFQLFPSGGGGEKKKGFYVRTVNSQRVQYLTLCF